jgi:tellurite resistance protein TehA-like permease
MRRRTRKFIGTSVTIVFVPVYALAAMALAQARPLREAPALIQVLCFAGLGLAWIAPMMPLIKWMERPDPGA